MYQTKVASKKSLQSLVRETMDKFLGVGLTNALGIALFTMLISVALKVIFTKYEIEGVSEVVRTA